MNKNRKWFIQAGKVEPEEWARRVGGMASGPVRTKVASLVWWDFFSGRHSVDRWGHLDEYLNFSTDEEVDNEALVAGLVEVGYPEAIAAERTNPKGRQVLIDGRISGWRTGDDNIRRAPGEVSVLCSVCEQAQDDVRSLVDAGVVSPSGKIRADWPPKNHNGVVGYRGRTDVKALLDWVLEGEYEGALRTVGIRVGFNEILSAIGLGEVTRGRVA